MRPAINIINIINFYFLTCIFVIYFNVDVGQLLKIAFKFSVVLRAHHVMVFSIDHSLYPSYKMGPNGSSLSIATWYLPVLYEKALFVRLFFCFGYRILLLTSSWEVNNVAAASLIDRWRGQIACPWKFYRLVVISAHDLYIWLCTLTSNYWMKESP